MSPQIVFKHQILLALLEKKQWIFLTSIIPVLLQSLILSVSLRISRLCCRQSPSASMPPELTTFVTKRYRPWKNGRQKNRTRTKNSLLAWGNMVFELRRHWSQPQDKRGLCHFLYETNSNLKKEMVFPPLCERQF